MAKIQPADALVVIDVGNTRVGFAIWDEDGLHEVQRVSTGDASTWRAALEEAWSRTAAVDRREVIIGSVHPAATIEIAALVEDVCQRQPLLIRDDLPLPIEVDIDNPAEVGIDRVCAAAAAYDRIGDACAVASFGTAITVDCVSEDGKFLGGAILPGFDLSLAALSERTAQLPEVEYHNPATAFGKNTQEAMINGVAFGAVGALREIVERYATELGKWPHLVVTGGNALRIHELADFVDAVVPNLALLGIALAHRKAAGQK